MEQLTFVTELVLDLVPELDVPGQVLVRDQNSTHWTSLFGHQGVFAGIFGKHADLCTFEINL